MEEVDGSLPDVDNPPLLDPNNHPPPPKLVQQQIEPWNKELTGAR
jgi:hypothetical protein